MKLSLDVLAQVMDAQRIGSLCQMDVEGICIDSRKVKPGDLFVALPGASLDGHQYVAHAFDQGACAALVEKNIPAIEQPMLLVADAVAALAKWAAYHRSLWPGTMVGITGSAGKTTTRAMVQSVLEQHHGVLHVHATKGNYNNHLGVPLTLSRLSCEHKASVMELGASAVGEIADLTAMVQPDVAVLTCVAPAHIEGFGSLQDIARGKGEIFAGMQADGCAIVALDDAFAPMWLAQLADRRCITFGYHEDAMVRAVEVVEQPTSIAIKGMCMNKPFTVSLQGVGKHLVPNALAALAVGHALGIAVDVAIAGLQCFQPVSGRMHVRPSLLGKDIEVLDDTYNANPASFAVALGVLAARPGKKILAMGGMLELGDDSDKYHRALGQQCLDEGVDFVVGMGEHAHIVCEVMGERGVFVHSHDDMLAILTEHLTPQSTLLVKGSRRWQLNKVVDRLCIKEGEL